MKLSKYKFTQLKHMEGVTNISIRTIDQQPFPPRYLADVGYKGFMFTYEYNPGREEWVSTWN